MKQFLLPLTLASIVTGCASSTDRFKLMSTDAASGTISPRHERVKGEACNRSILFFIPLEKDGTLEAAVANALEKSDGGNALTDLKVTRKNLMTVLYNYRCTEVEGTVAILK